MQTTEKRSDAEEMLITDIIIPCYNQSILTVGCLRSIREHTDNYRLILIDNGSEAEQMAYVYDELDHHPHHLIRNQTNVGFTRAINQGLRDSENDFVVLLNNDTEVAHDWIAKLKGPFDDPVVGASGPLSSNSDSWQGREALGKGFKKLPKGKMLSFFCVMLSRVALRETGYLDENFRDGLGSDDDYCHRLEEAGYRLVLVRNLVIKHHSRATFKQLYDKDEIDVMTAKSMLLFQEKKNK